MGEIEAQEVRTAGPPHGGQHLLTVREVAEEMRVSTMTVYRLIKAGDLHATRVGRSYRLREGEVEAYLSDGGR